VLTSAPETSTLTVQLDDATLGRLAAAVAVRVAALLPDRVEDCWFDSGEAADYLRLPLSQLRKLSAADLIPAHQDTPGGRLYFLRSELDEWRRSTSASR
jgi:hypothetical protein